MQSFQVEVLTNFHLHILYFHLHLMTACGRGRHTFDLRAQDNNDVFFFDRAQGKMFTDAASLVDVGGLG
jgi:hypothetical protein